MAGHEDEDNSYDDDDLDALPQDALLELENNAIQFTQAQTEAARGNIAPSSDYGDDFEDDDFDDAVLIDESRDTPVIHPAFRLNPGQATQQEQFRQQRYGNSHPNPSSLALASRARQNLPPKFDQPSRNYPPPVPAHDSMTAQQGSQPSAALDVSVDSLQRQIEELIKERNSLKEDLNAKAGEIAIVRSKQEKTSKQYEKDLAALRKINEDKLSKQQKALEAARIAEKNAATERDFIKQDLVEEAQRARRLGKAKDTEKKTSTVTTPKKKKSLAHRDGFEDDEIEILSPSKISPSKFQKRNAGSPARPGKRKRKANESPAGALEVIMTEAPTELNQSVPIFDEAILARLGVQDDRFDFIGTMLDHRIDGDHLRTLEELGRHALPSAPHESLQSMILGKLPMLGLHKNSNELPVEFCELLILLWSRCMEEKYLEPIHLIIDMLAFALEMKTTLIAPHVVNRLVPLAQDTASLVINHRFNNQNNEDDDVERHIKPTACMSLLYLTAQGCMGQQRDATKYWKAFSWTFVCVMLSFNQDEADYDFHLRLLSTSVFKDSIGAITEDEGTQEAQTTVILERLSYALGELPSTKVGKENIPFEASRLSRIRIQILQLLTSFTRSTVASKAMAMHSNVIGRLVRLISDQLDVLYDYKAGHEEIAKMISLAIRLLHHIVTKYDDIIDMQSKLMSIPGGSQKYLVCLSRLNFSDDPLILESEIDADVVTCALEMLNLFVTPEEGEAIYDAFAGP